MKRNASGWFVWTVCEYNDAGDLTRVTTVKTDTANKQAAEGAYLHDMARHCADGYKAPASYSIAAE